jgi:hypothetical protein
VSDESHFEGMTPEQIERAKSAKCQRCKDDIVGSASMSGTVFVNYWVPAVGVRARMFLCGACGLAFREFMAPELTTDGQFQAIKNELLSKW